ncbi:GGDEF domain-containing protein [Thermomonas brevis]|uniref:GGDEF domain-containing protein n=1 Tax=Thermomonas brevis TaxID=215691 RepID=A0A7G9QQE8_9GAMM|nr:GGDEF domain-containing protein [Thermomonas brevis]QNN45573.1 GGDEF domain-containing protein [Thermomonas brevis]
MPHEIVHTIGSTIYFVFFLLFLWARRVPRTNPGAGWWALAMAFALASRLAFIAVLPYAGAATAMTAHAAFTVLEKIALVTGLATFFGVDLPRRRLQAAVVAAEAWLLACLLLGAPEWVRDLGVVAYNAGFLACAAWIAYAHGRAFDRRLMLAVSAVSALLVLHWLSVFAIAWEPSWRRNGFLLGMALTVAQYFCLLSAVFRSFQQRLLEAEAKALDMAFQDPLTGLSNRRYMDSLFDQALLLANRPHQFAAVFYIDIDNFKPINDRDGHRVGDAVLKTVAARLRATTRSTDICARIGGDEFAAICTQLDRPEQAHDIARKLLEALMEPLEVDGRRYALGASIGASLYPLHGDSLPVLLEHADRAMYGVKSGGKNGYRMHAPEPATA